MRRTFPLALVTAASVAVLSAQGQQPGSAQPGSQAARPAQQPARDTPAQPSTAPVVAGRLSGRVLAADTGRPVKRARVFITAAELPGGRGVLTDDSGTFDFTELPAGRYTLTASKSGFIGLSYGQRRPLQAGTPLQLADGQQLQGIDFRLPRGGVVAGHVFDEDGDAMPGATVRVMRYQYQQGDRRLVPAGTSQTDDKGSYRVWGLNPGDYYVSAVTRIDLGNGGGGGRGAPGRGGAGGPNAAAGIANALGGVLGGNVAALLGGQGDDQDRMSYAPTYFPGVASINEARSVTVGVSQEVLDVDFSLQLVRASRVSGHVDNPDGTRPSGGNVNLTPEGAAGGRGNLGTNFGSRISWDGSFAINNVPPGRYTLRARSNDSDEPLSASQPLSVAGGDLTNVGVVLAKGGMVSGTVAFESTQTPVPGDLTQVRVGAPSTDPSDMGPNPNARVDKNGAFTLDGVSAGSHLIRPNGGAALRGWTLKSVTVGGRDITDIPIDVKSNQRIDGVTLTFTDRLTEIGGSVTDDQNVPVTEFTVLAFSTDASLWRAQSRQIMTARPDQTGMFKIRGLPAGEYYVATVDPSEQGEWFEPAYLDQHRQGATRVTLADGDVKTQNFRVRR
jgi:uncharacterized protein (DUF2141 family)